MHQLMRGFMIRDTRNVEPEPLAISKLGPIPADMAQQKSVAPADSTPARLPFLPVFLASERAAIVQGRSSCSSNLPAVLSLASVLFEMTHSIFLFGCLKQMAAPEGTFLPELRDVRIDKRRHGLIPRHSNSQGIPRPRHLPGVKRVPCSTVLSPGRNYKLGWERPPGADEGPLGECRLNPAQAAALPCDILRAMQVKVRFLGMLREIAGREGETVELADGARLGDLYVSLQHRIPQLQPFRHALALAVNYEYSAADTRLREGDEVALRPPVSGGSPENLLSPGTEMQATEHAALVGEPIRGAAISAAIRQAADGAVVVFEGVVRNQTRERRTQYLVYSAYEPMALMQMEQLAEQALANYRVREVWLVHRLGRLEIGETSVFIAVASAHRAAAFEACRWLIDTLKKTVPIWKKEYFEDGAVWADGEPFPPQVLAEDASK